MLDGVKRTPRRGRRSEHRPSQGTGSTRSRVCEAHTHRFIAQPAMSTRTAGRQHIAGLSGQEESKNHMLSRTTHSSVVGRSASIRRMRRRSLSPTKLYCRTNGCTSFLELHPERGLAVCHVCGYKTNLH